MTIAKITMPGLTAMGLSVAFLWGCLIGEHVLVQRAARQQAGALHDIRLLRQRLRAEPARAPVPRLPHPYRAETG